MTVSVVSKYRLTDYADLIEYDGNFADLMV